MTFKIDNRTSTLVDKVEMSILDYIKEKKLVPGDTLPNEMMLSSELGISRNVFARSFEPSQDVRDCPVANPNEGLSYRNPHYFWVSKK